MAESKRGGLLTFFAVIFGLLAIEDFLKPFHLEGPDTGIVFFGHRLQGNSAYFGWLVAIFLFGFALGIWRMRSYALAMGYTYAVYVLLNIVIFTVSHPAPKTQSEMVFGIVYSALAIGGTWFAAILLTRRRSKLI